MIMLIGIIGIIFVFIAAIFFIGYNAQEHKSLILIIPLAFLCLGLYFIHRASTVEGEKDGAYNQLRGKYEISYVISSDSVVTDTIINFK